MANNSLALDKLVICSKCHTVHEKLCIDRGDSAKCSRCGKELYHYDEKIIERILAISITAFILFVVANLFPLVRVEILGHEQHVTILSMILALYENDFYIVGIVVSFLIFIFPFMIVTAYIALSWMLVQRSHKKQTKDILILLSKILPWSMAEIYLVSILVALVKLVGYMQIHFGLSFWALVLFVVFDIYLTKRVNLSELWELRYRIYGINMFYQKRDSFDMTQEQLLRCNVCEAVNVATDDSVSCHRCQSSISTGVKHSTSNAWAFLITALILYIPANVYPILISSQLGSQHANTIVGGIILLWEEGSYPIALIILVASVVVPILKFIVLIYLLLNIQIKRYRKNKINQHKLHYMTELIGPWSMVDVFVVSVLTGLVNMTTIKVIAGTGATAFVLMVLFTMFAALSIDTRLFERS